MRSAQTVNVPTGVNFSTSALNHLNRQDAKPFPDAQKLLPVPRKNRSTTVVIFPKLLILKKNAATIGLSVASNS
jgi:hypothetical protein